MAAKPSEKDLYILTRMKCDVSDEQSVKAMVDETAKQFGTVDVLINNAAYFMRVWKGPFWEMKVEEFDKAMAVNVRGSWLCAKAAVPHMQKQKKGKIINISSNVALTGNPNYIHYVTSKGALIAMTRAMARELGEWNICVNTVTPGFVVTEGRQVDPAYEKIRAQQRSIKRTQVEADLVGTVLFLSSPDSDFMQIFDVERNHTFAHNRVLPVVAFRDLVANRIPEHFPKLRFGFIEAAASWVPYIWHVLRRSVRADLKQKNPQDLFRDYRFWIACEADEELPHLLNYIGEDHIVIGSDYGHNDPSKEPEFVKNMRAREDVSPAVVEKILSRNARQLYGLS